MKTIFEQKDALRKEMYKKRANNTATKEAYDLWVCKQLEQLVEEKKAKVIHAYLPMGTEIDIRPFLEKMLVKNIKVFCPKTLPKRQLENLELHTLNDLEKGVFDTSHPANSKIYSGNYDLIIVPGLAFDHQNYRLGYGGGYYDAFLDQQITAFKVGVFYPFQKVTTVPKEKHDVCLDQIIYKELF